MADYTIDVAIIKEMIVYARFLGKDRAIHTGMVGIADSCAISIMSVLQKLREENEIDIKNKLVAFGSDGGASVMVGRHNGLFQLY